MNDRWSNLFADLEGQLAHELEAEELDFRGEEERLRLARLSLRDRVEAVRTTQETASAPVTLVILDGSEVRVRIATTGRDWLAGDVVGETGARSQVVVPFTAIAGMLLTESQVRSSVTRPGEGGAASRDRQDLTAQLGLGFVLRDFARRRRAVWVVTLSAELYGTIDRVGRDHFDLAVHEPDSPRRQSAVRRFRVVLFSQVALVRLG